MRWWQWAPWTAAALHAAVPTVWEAAQQYGQKSLLYFKVVFNAPAQNNQRTTSEGLGPLLCGAGTAAALAVAAAAAVPPQYRCQLALLSFSLSLCSV